MTTTTQECTHHWMIATANGPGGSKGVCRRCGEVREFQNSIDTGDKFAIFKARGGLTKTDSPTTEQACQGQEM